MKSNQTLKIRVESSEGIKEFSLDSKSEFTFGFKPTNTFQIYGDQVPAKFKMLQRRKQGFKLKLHETMSGKVIADDCPLSLADLKKHQLLP